MRPFLLNKDHDSDPEKALPWSTSFLTQDIELEVLFRAMAAGDDFLYKVVSKVFFSGLNIDTETIKYRQNILKDCLANPTVIHTLYDISVYALDRWKNNWFRIFTSHPNSILASSRGMMKIYLDILKEFRKVADDYSNKFKSEGFLRFFEMITKELTDEYFSQIENTLNDLKFPDGFLISAQLGDGNKGTQYTLHRFHPNKKNWLQCIFTSRPLHYYFDIHPRDQAGVNALSELHNESINLVANALAQANDHVLNFFKDLRSDLAFYIGCMNLHTALTQIGEPVSFPVFLSLKERGHSFKGLYDACLGLSMNQRVVGNDLKAVDKNLFIVTGANQGGKSTFLRSVGLAQLMMQCGMFVPAEYFCANICSNLFTHFKREEDKDMGSGKFDEELCRISDIVDHITPDSMLLFNESFAATNEREGSEIARQVVKALIENHHTVFFVTHLYDFAHDFYIKQTEDYIFLRAEHKDDSSRSYKLIEGAPLPTSYGIDLYNKIFNKT